MSQLACKAQWIQIYEQAVKIDEWGGQFEEAQEEYARLCRVIDNDRLVLKLTAGQKNTLQNIQTACRLRMQALEDIADTSGLSLPEMRRVGAAIEVLFSPREATTPFPVDMNSYSLHVPDVTDSESVFDTPTLADDRKGRLGGTLVHAPESVQSGHHTLSIDIDKIGLKDAQTYINAFMTVSVVDGKGNVVSTQDTPATNRNAPQHVLFDVSVNIPQTMEELKDKYLFFEFKHYKPKKGKKSVRCYTFMEYKEIEQGQGRQVRLELYKKPTDFSRRRVNLFTVKQLFLHVTCQVTLH